MRKTIDLKSLLQVLKKNFVLICLISVSSLLASVLYAKLAVPPTYISSIKVYINNKADNTDKMTQGDISSSQKLVSSYMVFMNDDEVFQKVAEGMDGKYSAGSVRSTLSFAQIGDSTFVRISAESFSPEDSQKLCTLAAINSKKVIEETTGINNIEIYGKANVPGGPASPSISMYALLGFVIGFAVSYIAFYIKMARDNTIKGKDTILENFNIPFFGEIPSFDDGGRGTRPYGRHR